MIGIRHVRRQRRHVGTLSPTRVSPGRATNANPLADFDDVRELQRTLQARGITLVSAADESSTGPASLMLIDPDGNPILIDQHVPKPKR